MVAGPGVIAMAPFAGYGSLLFVVALRHKSGENGRLFSTAPFIGTYDRAAARARVGTAAACDGADGGGRLPAPPTRRTQTWRTPPPHARIKHAHAPADSRAHALTNTRR
jgi:hypothetical protein